jgi:hypothetical protein
VADDTAGNASDQRTWKVKVDRTPPDVTLSGPLKEREGQELPEGSHQLNVDARDGDPNGPDSARRSGLRSIDLRVDGVQKDYAEQGCSTDSCSLSSTWTFDTSEYPGGEHVLEVIARDQMGIEKRTELRFRTRCCLGQSSVWGNSSPTSTIDFGDVNGDGLADAVSRDQALGSLQVSASTGSGFEPPQSWGSWIGVLSDMEVGDANGDGLDDMVGRSVLTGELSVALSDGTRFEPAQPWGVWSTTTDFQLADVDGDGSTDAVGRDSVSGQVVVGRSTGLRFQPAVSFGALASGHDVRFADVDGDDAADLVARNRSSQEVSVQLSTGATFESPTRWGALSTDYDLLTEDVHGDLRFDVIGSNPNTGELNGAASLEESFKTPETWGTFPTGYDLDVAEVTGDGSADLIGRSRVNGELRVAPISASDPSEFLMDSDVPADPDLDDELMDVVSDSSGGDASIAATGPKRKMLLGFQEPGLEGGTLPSAGQPVYKRMKEAGTKLVRFNVYWGSHKNQDGTYFFDKLGQAIQRAHDNGFRVYLTFTGGRRDVDYCNLSYNPNAISCAPGYRGTNQSEDRQRFKAEYVDFVRNAVTYAKQKGVGTYAIWNEPNLPGRNTPGGSFLQGTSQEEAQGLVTAYLYRELYLAASNAIWSIQPDAKVLVGEFAGAGKSRARINLGDPLTHINALEYLRAVVLGPPGSSSPLVADGVAFHLYQHRGKLDKRATMGYIGIGNITTKSPDPDVRQKYVQATISDLWQDGLIQTPLRKQPDGTTRVKRPGLLITEFGFLNQPRNACDLDGDLPDGCPKPRTGPRKRNNYWHTEAGREKLYETALSLARKGHVAWFVFYQVAERTPQDLRRDPTKRAKEEGMFDEPGLFHPDGTVRDVRHYGKNEADLTRYDHDQDRRAYCSIWRWAKRNGYHANAECGLP